MYRTLLALFLPRSYGTTVGSVGLCDRVGSDGPCVIIYGMRDLLMQRVSAQAYCETPVPSYVSTAKRLSGMALSAYSSGVGTVPYACRCPVRENTWVP